MGTVGTAARDGCEDRPRFEIAVPARHDGSMETPSAMETPLAGVRVLDFSRVLAGPHCTRMLADLGAEVVKIEPPGADVSRLTAPRRHGIASYYAQQNSGKAAISVDLDQPDGVEVARELAARCDVLVENFRPGVMDRLGLGYDTVAAANPRVVYASISGYGATGPWRDRRAYASVVAAEVGLITSQGDTRDGVYRNDRHSHGDVYTGVEAAAAILAALYQRDRTGRGQWIDVSMAQTLLYVNEHAHDDLWDGPVDPGWIRTFGNEHHPVVRVADGTEAIVASHPAENGTFQRFMRAIERPELLDDARYATQADRLAHLDELQDAIAAYAATVPDVPALEAQFARHGLAVGAIRSLADVAASDWARQRDAISEVDDRGGGRLRVPNAPWRFSDAPGVGVHGAPRYRGEDNAAVLRAWLGLDDARIAELHASGALSQHLPKQHLPKQHVPEQA